MSEMKKWLKLMESVSPVISTPPVGNGFKRDATVILDARVGGGVGRFMEFTTEGNAKIDVKGIVREYSRDDFFIPERDLNNGNDWFHMSVADNTPGTSNNKPEFRPGDMVKIADVYGTVIGPGFGVFIGYGTTGQDCIVLFDGKQIVVPVENLASVLEQDAKDNLDQMDNDGNLSPMSFGSENVKIEQPQTMPSQETGMDHRDEFKKWMEAVEGVFKTDTAGMVAPKSNACGCGAWDCLSCFPQDSAQDQGQCDPCSMGNTDPEVDLLFGEEELGEEESKFETMPRSKDGRGVKLGDIVQKTEYRKVGQDSPLTYGEDNLDEEIPVDANPEDYGKAGRYAQDHFGNLGEDDFSDDTIDNAVDPEWAAERDELIGSIKFMQDSGLSNDSVVYNEVQMKGMPPEELRRIHSQVTGNVSEATPMTAADDEEEPQNPKPTKSKSPFDDLSDLFGPNDSDMTPASFDEPTEPEANPQQDMTLPAANPANTRNLTRNMTPSDQMRDLINRISPTAGGDEPELPDVQQNELVVRTAQDVPAVVTNAMRTTGFESPEWHRIADLPGFGNRNIRGMGRQVFGMFTGTPVEQIQTIANVDGQGPNTDAELRAVAGWLRDNAEDLGDIELDHGQAIPGYRPDVKEYRINGVRFHVVRDPMGQYIYAYPDADARLGRPMQDRLPQNQQRLREENMFLKATIFEQIKWDEEIDEAFIEESTLSKKIGKMKGGQKLVQWLHRRHQLDNDADLQPASFSERLLWKEFKANPDNFVIVSAENGVAGIKPYAKFIKDRTEEFRKKGKTYNPSGDSTLPYQIVAFTADGEQVDPALLRPEESEGDDGERFADPTVTKARMGKHHGRDEQNPDNAFVLLAHQIGKLLTVWVTGAGEGGEDDVNRRAWQSGAVPRDKINKRADLRKGPNIDINQAELKIFNKLKPVLSTLINQSVFHILNRSRRLVDGGNFEAAQKLMATGSRLQEIKAALDTSKDISLISNHNIERALKSALSQAAGSPPGSDRYNDYVKDLSMGSAVQLKPVLDAMRDKLIGL